jgi:hypothetical protein
VIRGDIQIDVLQRVIGAVPRIQVRNFDSDSHVRISPCSSQFLVRSSHFLLLDSSLFILAALFAFPRVENYELS